MEYIDLIYLKSLGGIIHRFEKEWMQNEASVKTRHNSVTNSNELRLGIFQSYLNPDGEHYETNSKCKPLVYMNSLLLHIDWFK